MDLFVLSQAKKYNQNTKPMISWKLRRKLTLGRQLQSCAQNVCSNFISKNKILKTLLLVNLG